MTHWAEHLTHPLAHAKPRFNPVVVGYGVAAVASIGVWAVIGVWGAVALMAKMAF